MNRPGPDTIASIITAPGEAAVSIIRISGPASWSIINKLTQESFDDRLVKLTWIQDQQGNKTDQVLVVPFKKPNSYTGEDVIEIQAHGGVWLTQKILELVLESGANLAKPGEFTERAVINGKIDLSQAEAINDIIRARTELAGLNAIKLYRGELGRSIKQLRAELLNLLGELTACIDFPDEVPAYPRDKFKKQLESKIQTIDSLLKSENEGHILRHGYKVALIGKPNAGKSTLLNTLLAKDRAIVTDIEGTTRDTIEESFNLKGLPVVLVDTAGIREEADRVEQIGIQRSITASKEADLILHLIDLSKTQTQIEIEPSNPTLIIGTKKDLAKDFDQSKYDLSISSQDPESINTLKNLIYQKIIESSSSESSIKVNHRQAELLRKAKQALGKSLESSELSEDFWTIDLRAAIQSLGEITGESLTESLLDNIFSRFCIGK